jgi:hypothetical protein
LWRRLYNFLYKLVGTVTKMVLLPRLERGTY